VNVFGSKYIKKSITVDIDVIWYLNCGLKWQPGVFIKTLITFPPLKFLNKYPQETYVSHLFSLLFRFIIYMQRELDRKKKSKLKICLTLFQSTQPIFRSENHNFPILYLFEAFPISAEAFINFEIFYIKWIDLLYCSIFGIILFHFDIQCAC